MGQSFAESGSPSDREIKWRQYATWVDLYKFYLDIVLKTVVFYYAITGGIISFYFANRGLQGLKFSLLFPSLMGLGFMIIFISGAILLGWTRKDIFAIRDYFKLLAAPDVVPLIVVLVVFSFLFLAVVGAMGWLFWFS